MPVTGHSGAGCLRTSHSSHATSARIAQSAHTEPKHQYIAYKRTCHRGALRPDAAAQPATFRALER